MKEYKVCQHTSTEVINQQRMGHNEYDVLKCGCGKLSIQLKK